MKAKDFIIILPAFFVLGLAFPCLKQWLAETGDSPAAASGEPRISLPEAGAPEDAFTARLLQASLNARPKGNILLAPNSFAAALMQLKPLSNEGLAAQLASIPLPDSLQDSAAEAHEAACLFADSAAVTDSASGHGVFPAPFSKNLPRALSEVNNAISSFTQGGVGQVISSDQASPETGILAVNALSFHSSWLCPVRKENSRNAHFFSADGRMPRVRMMQCKGAFRIAEDPSGAWKAAALFFRNDSPAAAPRDSCCLVVILPHGGSARKLAADLGPAAFAALRTALARAPETEGSISLPVLSFRPLTQDVTPLLHLLGLRSLFAVASPLPGLSGNTPLPFSRALQCCSLTLAESGDDASARASTPMPDHAPVLLQADKPFIWFIGALASPAPPYALGIVEDL